MDTPDYKELARLTATGDSKAASQLLELQRQGKALRLYLEPRTNLRMDGCTPVVMSVDDHGLIRMRCGVGELFSVQLQHLGAWCRALRTAIHQSATAFLENPHASHAAFHDVDGDFSFDARGSIRNGEILEGVQYRFRPVGALDWTFNGLMAAKMLLAVMNIMEKAYIQPEQCGFDSYDEFEEILKIALSVDDDDELDEEEDY